MRKDVNKPLNLLTLLAAAGLLAACSEQAPPPPEAPEAPPEEGEPFEAILRDLEDHVVPGLTHWNHPGFFAYFPSNASGPAVLAEFVAAALNQNAMLWRTSPAGTELEERMVGWIRDLVGLPDDFTGVLQDTASSGSFTALLAAREEKDRVESEDIEEARDKVMMGLERENLALDEEEKRLLAYHEGGHAVLAALLPNADPLHKVTIVPRGRAMGVTQQLPEKEKLLYEKKYMLDRMAVMMGGRAAENLIFDTSTSGAGASTPLPNANIYILGASDPSGSISAAGSRKQVAASVIAGGWTATQNANFAPALEALLDALGAGVVD